MKRLVALYRSPTYSPEVHRRNDTAILDATVAGLERRGWQVSRTSEGDVAPAGCLRRPVREHVPGARRVGAFAHAGSEAGAGGQPPESVLNCHRHRLVGRMAAAGLPFPRTLIVPTDAPQAAMPLVHQLNGDGRPVWVKRGDVHAETSADVVAAKEAGVERRDRRLRAPRGGARRAAGARRRPDREVLRRRRRPLLLLVSRRVDAPATPAPDLRRSPAGSGVFGGARRRARSVRRRRRVPATRCARSDRPQRLAELRSGAVAAAAAIAGYIDDKASNGHHG